MIQRMVILLLLTLILPDIYIFKTYILRLSINPVFKLLYLLPGLILLGGLIYFVFIASEEVVRGKWMGWFSITLLCFTIPKILFSICSLIGAPFFHLLHWSRAPFLYAGLVLAIVSLFVLLYGSWVGRKKFVVKEVTFNSASLPPGFDGYRIALLSDLHIGSWYGYPHYVQNMVDLTNKQQADIILFTGDLVNNRAIELNGFENILSQLSAPDGVYSVLGNHDFGPYFPWKTKEDQDNNLIDLKQRQASMGWELLNNENRILHRGNDSIALVGVENDGEPPFSQYADLPKALIGTEGLFKVLMSHNPTHWRREVLPDSDIQLMLAGHTHAMQLILGGYSPSSHFYREWDGMYKEGDRGLYVNIGAGFVGLPFRFGAWPEITIITLKNE